MTEYDICVQIADYLTLLEKRANSSLILWFHIANERKGGKANIGWIKRLKRIGLKPGVPDYFIMTESDILFLEVKTPTGRLSPSQKDFAIILETMGREHNFAVVRSFEEAKEMIDLIF